MTGEDHSFDVGAVIARAAELKQQSEDALTPAQLREVGRELGIEDRFVDAAVRDLERRRAQAQAQAQRQQQRKKQLIAAFVAVDIAVVVVLALSVQLAKGSYQPVEQERAAVAAALRRQDETDHLFLARAGEREADAELAGARNRVAIAMKRYDAAAVDWNGHGVFASVGAALAGLPDRAPLSTERASW